MDGWTVISDISEVKRMYNRVRDDKANVVRPEIKELGKHAVATTEPKFLSYTEELVSRLSSYSGNIDKDGFASSNAIVGDFNGILNVGGIGMNPASVTPISNIKIRESLSLAMAFSDDDEEIFNDVFHAMFSNFIPANLSLNKVASSGFPFFRTDVDFKKKLFFEQLDSLHDAMKLVRDGKLSDAYAKHGYFFAYSTGRRDQPDKVSFNKGQYAVKERFANDETYARTAGSQGSRIPADRNIRVRGRFVPNHFAMRVRNVQGSPSCTNYLLSALFSQYRGYYLDRFSFTWKHTGLSSLKEKISSCKYVLGADVNQFDQSVSPLVIKKFVELCYKYFNEDIALLIDLSFRMPYYQANPFINGGQTSKTDYSPFFGDPFDLNTFTMELGLPSGAPYTPDFGKWAMVSTYLCMINRHTKDVREVGIEKILRGQHLNYSMLNSGDDNVFCINDVSLYDALKEQMNDPQSFNYFRVEFEYGISFLGMVIFKNDSGQKDVANNLVSMILKWEAAEKSILHRSRIDHFYDGFLLRNQLYGKAPLFNEIYTVWNDVYQKHYNEQLNSRFLYLKRTVKKPMPAMSDIDLLVLFNPDYLHYRFKPDQVSKFILDQTISTIPYTLFFDKLSKLIN